MRNIKVGTSLLAVLTLFATMIVVGGVVGIFALHAANSNARRLHEIARQTTLVNDGYKDSARTRSALVRAYSALKENNDPATRDSALQSAKKTFDLSAQETEAFRNAPRFDGLDDDLKQQLVKASTHLPDCLQRATDALRNGDTAAYAEINDRDVTMAAREIAAGNLDLSSRTEQQSASLEETAATSEQRVGIEQVGQAVSQMDQVTQQNAALVEQAAAAAGALEQQAQSMKNAVAVFSV